MKDLPQFAQHSEHTYHNILELAGLTYLGSGSFRDVFALDKDRVIKIAKPDQSGCRFKGIEANIAEFSLYGDVSEGGYYEKIREWLAPVYEISSDGVAIIQARTMPITTNKQIPPKLPRWVTDVKLSNVGILNNKMVFHDYQWNMSINDMVRNHKLINHKLVLCQNM